jgi:hypothetical protein
MYILTMLMASIQVFGPFMPGVTVDHYGRMIMDVNKTRAVVMTVIPQNSIKNTNRCNRVLVQFDNITKAIDEYDKVFVKQGKQLVTHYASYDSKREDFQTDFTVMDEAKGQAQKKILAALVEMKKVMTPDEWKAVFNPQG